MRLIDANEVIKSLFDYTDGTKTIGQCIDDVPTVNAVSEEVYTREYILRKDAEFKAYKLEKAIDEIKAEIEKQGVNSGMLLALKIIDEKVKEYTHE